MLRRIITILTVAAILCATLSAGITSSAVYVEGVLYGDIDGSGVVDTDDARLALKIASGLVMVEDADQLERGDVNFDGNITISDARQILRGAAGLATLQPSGAFTGFDDGGIFGDSEELMVEFFNACLNRIKDAENKNIIVTNRKIESDNLTYFNIKEVELPIVGNATAEGISSMVRESLVEEDAENVIDEIGSGKDKYDHFAVEGEDYVSNLTVNDIYAAKAWYTEEENSRTITIQIALPDTEIEMATQSAYAAVLNTTDIINEQNTTLMKLMKANSGETSMLRELKNCVLTLVVDASDYTVETYTIAYQSRVYVAQTTVGINNSTILKATLKGIEFKKDHVVKYENFQWI